MAKKLGNCPNVASVRPYGLLPPAKEAAKLKFPTDAKARHAYRHECKLAWKAQRKTAKA